MRDQHPQGDVAGWGGSDVVVVIDGAVDDETCRALVSFHTGRSGVVYWPTFRSVGAVVRMVDAVLDVARDDLRVVDPLHPETVLLAALDVGESHVRHADNCTLSDGRWVPNHTPQRDVSAVYYLNNDFDGGEIVFDGHDLKVRPRSGLLLVFGSGAEDVHEVLPIRSGVRRTM